MFNIKSLLANPFAKMVYHRLQKEAKRAVADQQSILNQLVKTGKGTQFGKDHGLDQVKDYESFKKAPMYFGKGSQSILLKQVARPAG
jgi:hypothetical protein